MYKKLLYKKAYRLLERSTPLKFDCGLLCGSKCCTGDSDSGMCLFPGEEEMLEKRGDFLKIRKDRIKDTDVLFAVCGGSCDRSFRPIACRIFPYTPYLDEHGRLNVIEDPRAKYLCPLLASLPQVRIDRIFRRRVLNAFQLLIRDDDIRNHLILLSGVLNEYKRFVL